MLLRRKTLRYSFVMILTFMFALLFFPSQAKAIDETMPEVKYQKNIGISLDDKILVTTVDLGSRASNAKKVTVKSSKKSVVEAKASSDKKSISLFANKAGSAKVTVTVTKKNGKKSSYPINVTVYKYINPVKSFKIGSKSFSFKKKSQQEWSPEYGFYDEKMKAKISVTPKAGWKLKAIYTNNDKKVKNKSKVTIKGTDFTYFIAEFYNAKQKLTETVDIGINEWVEEEVEE